MYQLRINAIRRATLIIFPILIGLAAEDYVIVVVSFLFFSAYDVLLRAEFLPEVVTPSPQPASASVVVSGDLEGLK